MGDEPGSNIPNNYGGATSVNTSIPWTSGDQAPDGKIDAHVDGIVAYAKNLSTISTNVQNDSAKLPILGMLPSQALGGAAFAEGVHVSQLLNRNANEFMHYVSKMAQAVMNSGYAGQAVADSLSSTDDLSAITINEVNFAYGDPNAARPNGFPPTLGKTWQQAYDEQQAKLTGNTNPTIDLSSGLWNQTGQTTDPTTGAKTTTYQGPDGETRTVWEGTVPGGQYVGSGETVETIKYPNGQTVVTQTVTTSPGNSVTYNTTTAADGTSTTTSSKTSTTSDGGNTTTTTTNDDGSKQITITSDDGTKTTSVFDKDGNETNVAGHGPQAASPKASSAEDNPYNKRMTEVSNTPALSPW